MHIGILSTFDQACGIATHTADLCRAFEMVGKEAACKVTVYGERIAQHVGSNSEQVVWAWNREHGFGPLLALLRSKPIDVLHIQFQDGLFRQVNLEDVLDACAHYGIATFMTLHSAEQDLRRVVNLINKTQRSFVMLEQARLRYIGAGAIPDRLDCVPHGYWPAEELMSKRAARAALGLPVDVAIVGGFGFIEERKGILEVIDAIPALCGQQPTLYLHAGAPHPFDMAGKDYLRRCRERIAQYGCGQLILLHDQFVPVEQANLLLCAADVLLMNYQLNRAEASGAAAFALKQARPLVTTTRISFAPLQACSLQVSDEQGLANTLQMVIDSPTLADYLIQKSRQFLEENSFVSVVKSYLQEYRKMQNLKIGSSEGASVTKPFCLLAYKNQPLQPGQPNGGAETAALAFARFLAAAGEEVVFAAVLKEPCKTSQGVEFWDYGVDYDVGEILSRAQQRGPFHLVAIGDAGTLVKAASLSQCRSRIFMSHAGSVEDTGLSGTELLRHCQKVVCVSEAHKQIFTNSGVPASGVQVIYNGVDTDVFFPPERQTERLPNDLHFSGALVEGKGLDVLLPAFCLLKEHYPELRLHIYGGAGLWGRSAFFDPAEVVRTIPDVHFYGIVPQQRLAQAYRSATLCIFPSTHFECFPLTLLEAQACGCPVVASRVGGVAEAVVNGRTGVLIDEISPENLAQTVGYLLRNRTKLADMSQAAALHVRQNFSWEKMVGSVRSLLASIIYQV